MSYPEPNLPDPGRERKNKMRDELQAQILHDITHPSKAADKIGNVFGFLIVTAVGIIVLLGLLWVIVHLAGEIW